MFFCMHKRSSNCRLSNELSFMCFNFLHRRYCGKMFCLKSTAINYSQAVLKRYLPGQLHVNFVTQVTRPPPIRHAQVDAISMAYLTYENANTVKTAATPVLVIHGLMGSKNNWATICKGLLQLTSPVRKIIAVDARNHGDSPHTKSHSYAEMTADILQLLKMLNINKVCLMGHSMGGRAAMHTAIKHPNIVEQLIVVDISPVNDNEGFGTLPIYFEAMDEVKFEKYSNLSEARRDVDLQLAQYVQNISVRQFFLLNLIQKEDGSYGWRVNLPVLRNAYSQIATFPHVGSAQYTKPTIFIGGTLSDFLPTSDIPEIKKLFPTAQFHFIENADHWVHAERPNEFLGITSTFLNQS